MFKFFILAFVLSIPSAFACVQSNKVLEYNNAVTCNRQTGTKVIDFRFNTPQKVLVKIKDINILCAQTGTNYFFSWVIFDDSGAVLSDTPFESEMFNSPGAKQALRVNVIEPEKCGYFMLEFSSDFLSVYP